MKVKIPGVLISRRAHTRGSSARYDADGYLDTLAATRHGFVRIQAQRGNGPSWVCLSIVLVGYEYTEWYDNWFHERTLTGMATKFAEKVAQAVREADEE